MGDLANTTGSAFLGLTMSCCQCHDHKYDPLSQADHFRLRAFFAAVKPQDDQVISPPKERDAIRNHNEDADRRIDEADAALKALVEPARIGLEAEKMAALPDDIRKLLDVPRGRGTRRRKRSSGRSRTGSRSRMRMPSLPSPGRIGNRRSRLPPRSKRSRSRSDLRPRREG